ncbi:hypothetical protein ACC685_38880, partial [Rhizobium ruizarguesonis]
KIGVALYQRSGNVDREESIAALEVPLVDLAAARPNPEAAVRIEVLRHDRATMVSELIRGSDRDPL